MNGLQIFEKRSKRDYTGSIDDIYAQDLFTIYFYIGDAIYPLLEKAETENKRLEVQYPNDLFIDYIDVSSIFLV